MPIISLQRRLREAGRIRLGEQVETRDGKKRPSKLAQFRFTSPDELTIKTIASVYGGEPRPWEGAPVGEQWELYTESTALDVIVPPVEVAWSSWMENWSGAVCRNRCDGQTDWKNDAACSCDPDSPVCKPTSRLGVILTAVDGLGIFRLESHGWTAAQELNGTIELLRVIQDRGQMVPARLLLEQRQQKKVVEGKVQTFNFAVPVLDLRVNLAALTAGVNAPREISAAATEVPQLTPGVTPIQGPDDGPVPTVAEQLHAQAPEPTRRANAAAKLPPTRLAPRPAAAVPEPAPVTSAQLNAAVRPEPDSPASESTPTVNEPQPDGASKSNRTAGGASQPSMRRLFALLGGKGIRDDLERHAWASTVLQREVTTFSELTQAEVSKLNDAATGAPPPTEPEYGPDEEPFG